MSFMEWKSRKSGERGDEELDFEGLAELSVFDLYHRDDNHKSSFRAHIYFRRAKTVSLPESTTSGFATIEEAKICAEKYLIKKITKSYKLLMTHKELMGLNKLIDNYEVKDAG